MSLIARETGGAGAAPIEADSYPARCVGVVDLGIQHNDYNGKDQEKVLLVFELPTERITVDGVDKPRWLSKRYTMSLHEKATLRQHLDAWRGRPFTEEERKGFHLANVINAPCMVTVTNGEKNGYVTAKITGVSKPPKGMEVPPLENEPLVFDMDGENAGQVKAQLPNWMQSAIEESVSWKSRLNASAFPEEDDDGPVPF